MIIVAILVAIFSVAAALTGYALVRSYSPNIDNGHEQ